MSAFVPSPYQQAIFDYIKDGNGHLVVKAVAGGSKTTTALESLKYIPAGKRVLFLAYNKAIANTLQLRVPDNVKASTFHSHGFGMVKQLYPKSQVETDKVYNTVQELSKTHAWEIPDEEKTAFFNRIERLVNLMRQTLRTTREEIPLICEEFDIDDDSNEADYALEAFNYVHADTSCFDFADMIYIPATRDFRSKGFDYVYVDEFQDCSEAQYRFARKLLAPKGRLIVIGDPNQSIYAYQGAEPRLFQEALDYPNTVSLPLSISYRCSKAVVAHAQKLVREIEANPAAPQGEVIIKGSIKNVKDGDFILCRVNLPLVKLALHFIECGQKASINGSEVGKSIISFIRAYEDMSIDEMERKLAAKQVRLTNRLAKKFPHRDISENAEYQRFKDKVMIVEVLSEGVDNVSAIIAKVQRLFSDDVGRGIILSTVHKAKGLEAENVFILEPQLIPYPYNVKQEWQKQQERNIDYVARTRAISKLEYITDWSIYKQKRVGGNQLAVDKP